MASQLTGFYIRVTLAFNGLMILTIIRKMLQKPWPRTINYKSCNYFCNKYFKGFLTASVSNQIYVNSDDGFNNFF